MVERFWKLIEKIKDLYRIYIWMHLVNWDICHWYTVRVNHCTRQYLQMKIVRVPFLNEYSGSKLAVSKYLCMHHQVCSNNSLSHNRICTCHEGLSISRSSINILLKIIRCSLNTTKTTWHIDGLTMHSSMSLKIKKKWKRNSIESFIENLRPSQNCPSPEYPSSQVQLKEPGILIHCAFLWHPPLLFLHSSKSFKKHFLRT